MADKSLQINISSVDDAKSVIANLGAIKVAYEAHGCTSVEVCIMEEVVTPTAKILVGAFPWCVSYRKIIKPFGENVLFQLPHYCPRSTPASQVKQPETRHVAQTNLPPPVRKSSSLRRPIPNLPETLGNSPALVPPVEGANGPSTSAA